MKKADAYKAFEQFKAELGEKREVEVDKAREIARKHFGEDFLESGSTRAEYLFENRKRNDKWHLYLWLHPHYREPSYHFSLSHNGNVIEDTIYYDLTFQEKRKLEDFYGECNLNCVSC